MRSLDSLLRPSLAKIKRAKHHIDDLNQRISIFMAEKPYRLMIRHDFDAGHQTVFTEEKASIPEDFPLIIGDAIHNLRSALDLLMFSMIGNKVANPDIPQFPIGRSEHSFIGAMKSRQVKLAG